MTSPPLSRSDLAADVTCFREFNRMYTRVIGTLQEGLLNTEYSLAEARVLYELATRCAPQAKEIAQTLGMDPGYLSRLLAKFERASLLARKTSDSDNRASQLTLTRQGRAAFKRLDSLAAKEARSVLAPLSTADRAQLLESMKSIQQILGGSVSNQKPFVLRPHCVGDMGLVVSREGAGYAQEYGWDQTFEALVARIVADFITNFKPDRERCWIAEANGESLGHVFLVQHPDEPHTAKLRLLFVEPSARGLGLGRALVDECLRFARSAGYRKVVLWTQSILTAAHRIYQAAGFQLVRQEPHHSFGKDLIGETWELELV